MNAPHTPKPFNPKTEIHRIQKCKVYEDVRTRTIEIPQRSRILKGNHCLKVHNAHFKLVSSFSGLKRQTRWHIKTSGFKSKRRS